MSTVTDPIADLLARVRNGAHAQKQEMFVPYSKIKTEVVRIWKEEGYITDYSIDTEGAQPRNIKASIEQDRVSVVRDAETRSVKALHGLSRSLIHNMVVGVTDGFTKQLEIEGVGFKAAVQGSNLSLNLGFSHPILFPIP